MLQNLRATNLFQSPLLDRLAQEFGHKYESLTAEEKLSTATCLCGWQSDDTRSQDNGGDPIPFLAFIAEYDCDYSSTSEELKAFLLLLSVNEVGDDEAFAISIALIAQCQQGIFKRVEY